MPINNTIAARSDEMREWRQHLHANPELGFEEHKTAAFIAEKLESFGIETHRGIATTGVIGIIEGKGKGEGMIGLRADMDALPMQEENSFDHASINAGIMHACGHDGHTSMLLGAAKYLAETRNFSGKVMVIFQPAEEGGGGGKVMVDEGLFDRFNVSSVWGMHNWPGIDVGRAVVHRGASMAAADVFEITLTGRGGHAAMPNTTIDPLYAGTALVQAIQSVVSRRANPIDPIVVSVTQFHAGSTHNVIPDNAFITGTARHISRETGQFIERALQHLTKTIAEAHDCQSTFDWQPGYPPTINDAAAADRAAAVAADVLGSGSVIMDAPPSMAGEDFSYMLEARPGAYIWLGAGQAKDGGMLHNTGYDFNDDLLPLGASYWVSLVERELA